MLNKGKIIILAVIVASLLFKEGKSTRIKERKTFCYVCDNAANNKECNKNGPIECQPSQSSCLTEIRTIKPTAYSTGSVRITKRCKQDIACNSNERQNIYRSFHNQCNSDPSSRFSVCRHCCKDDKIHGCNKNLEGRGCPKMKAPKHGKLNCRSDKKGIKCKISCKSGFILSNASLSTITCRKDGTWSSIVPRCNPMISFGRSSVTESVCPTIKPTANAKLSCSEDCDGKDCFVGTTCNLQCEDGYISKGPTITSCDSDKKRKSGKWNPTLDKTLCEGCSTLKPPKNGIINCEGSGYKGKCRIVCDSGYIISDAMLSSIRCHKNGSWSNNIPRCTAVKSFERSIDFNIMFCPELSPILNANMICSDECDGRDCLVGTTCKLQCIEGYISNGTTLTSCDLDNDEKSAKWNPTFDNTKCEATRCPSLEDPTNGYLECTGSGHTEWCEVVCSDGYLISDFTMSNITCDKAGKWSSDVPRCEAMSNFGRSINFDFVFCEEIFATSHANITCSDDCDGTDCLVGSTCNLQCEDGYISTGPTVTSCKLDTEATLGIWNPTFENTICKGCPSLQEPINGYLKCSGTGYNKKCEVVCDVGHVISDASLSNVICLGNGSWSIDLPRCEAISNFGRSKDFNLVFCDEIATIPHADITCSENCNGVDCLIGTTCSIQCEAGYISNGPTFTSCDPIKGGKSATWNPVIDDTFCKESCKPLEAPANGSIACVNVNETDDVISACRVTCNAGYELVGTEVRFCNKSGLWSGENAKCIVSTVCPKLQPPVNGNMECIGDQTIPGGFSCKMSCIPGYILFGDDIRACMSDGTWSGKDTKCNEKRCLTLRRPMNGVLKCVKNKNIETCEIRCTAGYLISDSTVSSISCYNGVWPDHPPRCVRLAAFGRSSGVIGCPQINDIVNGKITCSEECNEGNCALGTECNLQCEDGYSSKGPTSTSCDPGEKTLARWIPLLEHTRCEENVVCTPFKVKNAVVECFGPVGEAGIGSKCYITCMYGLLLSGSALRVCGDDGQWTNDMPTCTASCKPLKSPPNGSITCVDTDEAGEYKSACRFTCDDGYQLIGQYVRYCDTLGIWSGKDSKCLPSTVCPTLRSPINGRIECIGDNSVSGEMSCKISCSPGYKLSGDKLKACLANGTWTGREVTCTEIECPPMNLPNNGYLKCTGNGQNEICQVVCDSGYLISDLSLSNITCDKDGSWSNVVPRCIAVDVSNFGRSLDILFCPELGEVPNGKISCLEECDEMGCFLGTVCNLQCEVGYISNGPTFTSCDLERNEKSTSWYPALDNICEKKIGCHPFQVNNGVVECFGPEGESGLGSQCHTTCMYGLSLNGPKVRYCLNNGQWSGYAPICTGKFCYSFLE
ncbi:sushi, von Willebrand factor type A, EGF and pentraxin domain-containing protein 1-like [Styela clava]